MPGRGHPPAVPQEGENSVHARRLTIGPLTVETPPGWSDITSELDDPDAPPTLGRAGGEGALQFSVVLHGRGSPRNPGTRELLEMSINYGEDEELGKPRDPVEEEGPLRLGAVGFRTAEQSIRIWHVSDGRNFACVCYTGPRSGHEAELRECEGIVRSLRFASPASPESGAAPAG